MFAEALDVKVEEVKRPEIAPTGHYKFRINKFVTGKIDSDKGEWDTLSFTAKPIEAKDDVNSGELARAGGLNSLILRKQFMFETGDDEESKANFDKTMWALKQFLSEHCGIQGASMRELIDNSKNAEFLGEVTHREDKKNKGIWFAEIGKTAPPNTKG